MKILVAGLLCAVSSTLAAAPTPTPVTPSGPSWAGMVLFIIIMASMAWFAKKYGKKHTNPQLKVRVVGGASLGGKERIAVIEVGGQCLVLGVAPGSITTLTKLPAQAFSVEEKFEEKPIPFAAVLNKITNFKRKPPNEI